MGQVKNLDWYGRDRSQVGIWGNHNQECNNEPLI